MKDSCTKKLVSIVVPCYNEEENVGKLYGEIRKTIEGSHARYNYECIFIDNA